MSQADAGAGARNGMSEPGGGEPIRVLVSATKEGEGRLRNYPPLVLNDAAGKPTPAAEDILRAAMPLPLAQA